LPPALAPVPAHGAIRRIDGAAAQRLTYPRSLARTAAAHGRILIMSTLVSEQEAARLRTLQEQAILDTPAEQAFDDLAYLAAEVCGTPMALVSFVDRERQWIKAGVGLERGNADRAFGFVDATLDAGGLLVIPDVLADPRHAANAAVAEPLLARFYAGLPLVTIEGHAIGALAVMDHVPRSLEQWQHGALRVLARLAGRELEVRHARRTSDRRRMESISTLAGGLAHEFNNLLTVILGSGHLLDARLPPGDPRHEDTRRILASARRAAVLTRQMLVFSRHRSLVPDLVDLNEVIGRRVQAWREALGERIRLDLRLASGVGSVKADRGQIETALSHLVLGAAGAMPDGGTLTVATADVEAGVAGEGPDEAVPPGRYVVVDVAETAFLEPPADPGRALPIVEVLRDDGRDPGPGLPAVFGIVTESGGYLRVASRGGGGAAYRVLLPHASAVST
jgi:signal transduction histidine kinase